MTGFYRQKQKKGLYHFYLNDNLIVQATRYPGESRWEVEYLHPFTGILSGVDFAFTLTEAGDFAQTWAKKFSNR